MDELMEKRAVIVNLALHPTKPMQKLPPLTTRRGRIRRAILCLRGYDLYGG